MEDAKLVYLSIPALPKSLKLSSYHLIVISWIIKRIIRNYQRYYPQNYL
jgi:hypothetical protein